MFDTLYSLTLTIDGVDNPFLCLSENPFLRVTIRIWELWMIIRVIEFCLLWNSIG